MNKIPKSTLLLILTTSLLIISLDMSNIVEISLQPHSPKNINMYSSRENAISDNFLYEYNNRKLIENCHYVNFDINDFLIKLFISNDETYIHNRLWIVGLQQILTIVSYSPIKENTFHQIRKNDKFNEIKNALWMKNGSTINNTLSENSKLEVVDWSPKELIYMGDYFRDYFKVFVQVKNTGLSNICISQSLLVDWTPRELLEEVQLSREKNFKVLHPGDETYVKYSGILKVIKPGCVKLILSIHSCGETALTGEEDCTCSDRITIKAVREEILQILSKNENPINKTCITTITQSKLHNMDTEIESLKTNGTSSIFSQFKILSTVLYYLFIVLILFLVMLSTKYFLLRRKYISLDQ